MSSQRPVAARSDMLDVLGDLVLRTHADTSLLIAQVDPAGTGVIGARGPLDASGAAHWVPRWRGEHVTRVDLRVHLSDQRVGPFSVRFSLPSSQRTLRCLPQRVALTDRAGFEALGRTRALRFGLVLPETSPAALAEWLPA